ncbi:hypothetical protein [Anaerobacillus arseniciselenatis]|nr:hypothetical protein [Anaerobacillus arseniciselenatis]
MEWGTKLNTERNDFNLKPPTTYKEQVEVLKSRNLYTFGTIFFNL